MAANEHGKSPTTAAILDLEEQRCNAMIGADTASLHRLLGDDLYYVHGSSRVEGKSAFIGSIQSGMLKFSRIDREEVTVRIYNATTAIVTGRARVFVRSKGEDKEIPIRFTNVWIRPDAGSTAWRMVTWQATKT